MPRPVKGLPVAELIDRIEDLTGVAYEPKTAPRPHQLEALAFALEVRKCLLFMKMRLGKTKTALDFATMLRKSDIWQYKGLVIVPQPVILSVWESEVEKHSDLSVTIARDLDTFMTADTDLIATSWSALQVMFTTRKANVKKGLNQFKADKMALLEASARFDLAIIDEIHTCKNPTTLRFQMGEILTSQCDLFMGLTGTPHGRNPYDLWAQAFLADRGQTLSKSYFFFKEAFGKQKKNWWTRSGYETVFDEKKMHYLERKLDTISISYGWKGYLEMPAITPNVVPLKMVGEQRRYYKEALDKLINVGWADPLELTNTFIRLRQISSGFLNFKNDDGEATFIPIANSVKTEWLLDFLEQAPEEAKIVIFHEFTPTGRMISEEMDKHKFKHVWMYGGTKDKAAALKKFQQGDVNVYLSNTATGGVGVDLSRADYLLFYESPISPTIRQQAEARVLGARTTPLTMDDLVCSPVERRILRYINEGRDLLSTLTYKGVADLVLEDDEAENTAAGRPGGRAAHAR